jgi:hypothetical protein
VFTTVLGEFIKSYPQLCKSGSLSRDVIFRMRLSDSEHIVFRLAVIPNRKSFSYRSKLMSLRIISVLFLFSCFVLGVVRTTRGTAAQEPEIPSIYVPPGKQMYKDYCAACHGLDGKGRGPVTRSLRKPPPDLTTLAKRHGGTFPKEYVTNVLRFGFEFSAHGSSEMPVWGPIFQYEEHYNEAAVRQRIKNLCEFLESIQRN